MKAVSGTVFREFSACFGFEIRGMLGVPAALSAFDPLNAMWEDFI